MMRFTKSRPLSRRSVLSLLCSGAVGHGADLGLTFFSGPALIPPFVTNLELSKARNKSPPVFTNKGHCADLGPSLASAYSHAVLPDPVFSGTNLELRLFLVASRVAHRSCGTRSRSLIHLRLVFTFFTMRLYGSSRIVRRTKMCSAKP
jgi:hypothetical protein